MVAARRAVGRMIDTMRDVDRFAVVAFDTVVEHSPAHEQVHLQTGTDRNRWNTLQWVSGIEARGGTEIERAVIASLEILKKEKRDGHEPVVVLITDGQVGAEDATLKVISKMGSPRFFTLGIDRAVNHGFLNRIAQMTGGTCETVETENQLDHVMNRFHREIGCPVITDVTVRSVDSGQITQLTPANAIALFADRPLAIHGRTESAEESIQFEVTGKLADGSNWTQTVSSESGERKTLTALWARQRIRDLEDSFACRQDTRIEKQIVAVSLEANVLSRFTAYVAVDRSEVVNEGGKQQTIVQPVEQPAGWVDTDNMLACYAAMPQEVSLRRKSGGGRGRSTSSKKRSVVGKIFGSIFEQHSDDTQPSSPVPDLTDNDTGNMYCEAFDDMDDVGGIGGGIVDSRPPSVDERLQQDLDGILGDQFGDSEMLGEVPESQIAFTRKPIDFLETGDVTNVSEDFASRCNALIQQAHAAGASAIVVHRSDGGTSLEFDCSGSVSAPATPGEFDWLVDQAATELSFSLESAYMSGMDFIGRPEWTMLALPSQAGEIKMIVMLNETKIAQAVSAQVAEESLAAMLTRFIWLERILQFGLQQIASRSTKISSWFSVLDQIVRRFNATHQGLLKNLREEIAAAVENGSPVQMDDLIAAVDSPEQRKAFWKS